jgi:hypothetical protein
VQNSEVEPSPVTFEAYTHYSGVSAGIKERGENTPFSTGLLKLYPPTRQKMAIESENNKNKRAEVAAKEPWAVRRKAAKLATIHTGIVHVVIGSRSVYAKEMIGALLALSVPSLRILSWYTVDSYSSDPLGTLSRILPGGLHVQRLTPEEISSLTQQKNSGELYLLLVLSVLDCIVPSPTAQLRWSPGDSQPRLDAVVQAVAPTSTVFLSGEPIDLHAMNASAIDLLFLSTTARSLHPAISQYSSFENSLFPWTIHSPDPQFSGEKKRLPLPLVLFAPVFATSFFEAGRVTMPTNGHQERHHHHHQQVASSAPNKIHPILLSNSYRARMYQHHRTGTGTGTDTGGNPPPRDAAGTTTASFPNVHPHSDLLSSDSSSRALDIDIAAVPLKTKGVAYLYHRCDRTEREDFFTLLQSALQHTLQREASMSPTSEGNGNMMEHYAVEALGKCSGSNTRNGIVVEAPTDENMLLLEREESVQPSAVATTHTTLASTRAATKDKERSDSRFAANYIDLAVNLYAPYKFVIAFENTNLTEGYFTEKLSNAYLAHAVPIYWGAPDIEKYINPKSMINCALYNTFTRCAERVVEVLLNDTLYREIQQAPVFQNEDVWAALFPVEAGAAYGYANTVGVRSKPTVWYKNIVRSAIFKV